MSLLTENPTVSFSQCEGGSVPGAALDFSPLEVPVEWMRFCEVCECEERFVAGWICDRGLVGCCSGCGDERVLGFTRMNSEVA